MNLEIGTAVGCRRHDGSDWVLLDNGADLEHLSRKAALRDGGDVTCWGNGEELPFATDSFDIVESHHCTLIYTGVSGLNECLRVVKSGGMLVFTIYNQYQDELSHWIDSQGLHLVARTLHEQWDVDDFSHTYTIAVPGCC